MLAVELLSGALVLLPLFAGMYFRFREHPNFRLGIALHVTAVGSGFMGGLVFEGYLVAVLGQLAVVGAVSIYVYVHPIDPDAVHRDRTARPRASAP